MQLDADPHVSLKATLAGLSRTKLSIYYSLSAERKNWRK